jgi:nucleotidyltransferase substrate binding protein (TIGR01987 family)
VALLRRAVARLASALAQPKDEFVRDSAIQRFEFTFELSWKTLKTYLELQGLEARSPRAAIREAFATGLLPEDPGWLAMVELRNLTSHTYEEELAEQVYAALPQALARFEALLSRLEEEGL